MTGTGKSRLLRALRDQGAQVLDLEELAQHRGSVLGNLPDAAQVCSIMHVEDIATGALHNITQNLGTGSTGCRLDPAALADVAEQLLAALENPVDLLILNRFGKGEAEGQGLRAVIEKAFVAGVPVLTVVRPEYEPDFQAFTGGTAQMLAPRLEDALYWAERAAFPARSQCGAA